MKTDKTQDNGLEELKRQLEEEMKKAETLQAEADSQKCKADEYKGLLQRVQADFENQLKRSDADRRELAKTASKDLVVKLLDIVDTMDFALKAKPKDEEGGKMLDGFRRVNDQLKALLAAEGVEEVRTDCGFDHDVHEAVETVEEPDRKDGEIVEVTQRGYKMNGRLIRTSKVIVVKNRGESNGESDRD